MSQPRALNGFVFLGIVDAFLNEVDLKLSDVLAFGRRDIVLVRLLVGYLMTAIR